MIHVLLRTPLLRQINEITATATTTRPIAVARSVVDDFTPTVCELEILVLVSVDDFVCG